MGYVSVVVIVAMMLQTRGASSRAHVQSFTIDQIALTALGMPPDLSIHARAMRELLTTVFTTVTTSVD